MRTRFSRSKERDSGQGLVINNVNHVAKMLQCVGKDVGATGRVFGDAQVVSFCSATLSGKMMQAEPAIIALRPYGIFVHSLPDDPAISHVGDRTDPDGPMKQVEAMLDEIVQEAIGF